MDMKAWLEVIANNLEEDEEQFQVFKIREGDLGISRVPQIVLKTDDVHEAVGYAMLLKSLSYMTGEKLKMFVGDTEEVEEVDVPEPEMYEFTAEDLLTDYKN